MGERTADASGGQLATILRAGAVGDVGDGVLLDRVARGRDEAAFAALVARHGPMVLRACRAATGDPHDAEDACQAVFLILARRAGSIRGRESAAGWLYGVARRVGTRARRDADRRRAVERRRAEQGARPAVAAPDPRAEAWAELYEEIDRLPARDRGAVVLCHLEGLSHEAAAAQLACPVRTLQSRLLRARAKLRDRLARRGVAPGAGAWAVLNPGAIPLGGPAPASWPVARAALAYLNSPTPAGMVPAGAVALAEGVLRMTWLRRIHIALAAIATLGLSAGLAWAVARGRGDAPPAPAAPAAQGPVAPPGAAGELRARGIVVDAAGRPVAGARVALAAFARYATSGESAADGSFDLPVTGPALAGRWLLARAADGDRLGVFRYAIGLDPAREAEPARVVLKPGRPVAVRVAGPDGGAIAGAVVEVHGGFQVFAEASTGADGRPSVLVPADARVEQVVALKPGRGVDAVDLGPVDENGTARGGVAGAELPDEVALTLAGARTVQVRAVDADGRPLAGVAFSPWLVRPTGRRGMLNLGGRRHFEATSGADGVATFDWLPPGPEPVTIWPASPGFAHRRVEVAPDAIGPVTATLARTEAIRGRVTHPDGTPAPGIRVAARGTGIAGPPDIGQGQARTARDGTYEMMVPPGEGYAVTIADPTWAARSRLDVHVRSGEPADGVDFALTRGTLIRGAVTVARGGVDRPAPRELVMLDEVGGQGPLMPDGQGREQSRQIRHQVNTPTDEMGRYSIRVGPGTYKLWGPIRTVGEDLTVADEAEVVRDFRMPRPADGPLAGRVVDASTGRGVAGAKVDVVAISERSRTSVATTDADGRFRLDRLLDPLLICARSADAALGAVVEVGAEDPEVTIALYPTASAVGRLLDEQGRPVADRELYWGEDINIDGKMQLFMMGFAPKVTTDAEGHFALPGLVVDREYLIAIPRDGMYPLAGSVRPHEPGEVDLGERRLDGPWAARATAPIAPFEGGPGVGAPAPPVDGTLLDGGPLRSADYRGKFVLLDFRAAWSAASDGEIPHLRAVHDEFGADGRLVVLGLHLDERVEAARRSQERHRLPWPQAFLGGGLRGPIPGAFGVHAVPAPVLVGPDGRIVARGMRGAAIRREVARALGAKP